MTALELIARLKDRGIRIAARDGELELDAPKGALDEELRAELLRRKPELLRLLAWSRRSGRDLPLERVDRTAALPLSWAQQRLWFLDQLEPGSSAYNISWTVRLKGDLNETALQNAFAQLIERHESLRTRFPDKAGQPRQHIDDSLQLRLGREELPGVSNEQLRARLGKLAAMPFDLAAGPLWRAVLIQLSAHEHILLVVIHHIVADGASMRVLFRELAACYEAELAGVAAELPELPVQYADYAVWQRQWLDSVELERQTDYWLEQLGGLPPLLELPWDRPRSAAMRYRGASVLRVLPTELADELRGLGRARGCTLFMVMLSAFYVLLLRYSGRDDLVVGTPMGGRPRSDLEGLIGFFINTVVLRADLSGDPTFNSLLHSVRDVALAAHANQELPFEKLVESLQPQRELSYSPVFQVMFDLQEEPRWKLPVRNLEVVPEVVFSSRTSSFDLTLSVRQAENGLDAMFEYDTDLFDETSIEGLASHYERLLEQIVANPDLAISQFSLIDSTEQASLVSRWADMPALAPVAKTLAELVAEQAGLMPDAAALLYQGQQVSYGEMNRRANRLAHRLQGLGVAPGRPVGIIADRVPETFIAVLGVLKAGGCAVPLDPSYPPERLAFMLQDAGAKYVLLGPASSLAAGLEIPVGTELLVLNAAVLDSPDYPDSNPLSLADTTDPAFLMYTSGTTGKPKGVGLNHRGLTNYISQLAAKTGLQSGDRVLQFASLSFDISIEESFAALLTGATLVLRDDDMSMSVEAFVAGCERYSINWTSLPTAWWHELCASLPQGPLRLPASLRTVIIGGEKARRAAFALWKQYAPEIRLFNTYGPTETSIAATWCELSNLDPQHCGELPIGHPVPNVSAWVLDQHLRPLPAGVPGELYIGGVGVAQGYWQRPALSAERFISDPFASGEDARLYRTGDRVRYLADGRLAYLGRMDEQLKLRGHRVEPGEIESVLSTAAGMESCVVGARVVGDADDGDLRLVAYFVGSADITELGQHARNSLPEYMVPRAFIRLPEMPLTANGKIDRHALPEPEWTRDESRVYVAPRNAVEQQIAAIWSEVLCVARVGVLDDFFALGGHSLLATQVVARIRDAVGADIPLRNLFATPTVAGLAAALKLPAGEGVALLPLVRRSGRETLLPLSWAQQRLWVLDRLGQDTTAYSVPWAARLQGKLNIPALQAAVDAIVQRHETLRTGFAEHDGEPVQLIAPGLRVAICHEELPATDNDAGAIEKRLQQLMAVPFDLSVPPLLRVHLLRIRADEHVLLLLLHHIVADGWSVGILFRELGLYYKAACAQEAAQLDELVLQYADYAIWQRDWLQQPAAVRQETYWLEKLADIPPVLELPTDYPRPPEQSNHGAWEGEQLPPALLLKLRDLAARTGTTLFMVSLAVFKAMLAIQVGREDIVVGTPIAGRRHTETEGLIGCFLNTLVLRTSLAADPSFTQLLERIKQTTLDAYDNQDLPFEKLLELLAPERSASFTPVVQVMFNLHNTPGAGLELAGLQVESFDLDRGTAKFDLSAVLIERHEGLYVGFEYNTDLFAAESIRTMLEQYARMLERVAIDAQLLLSELVRTAIPRVPQPGNSSAKFPASALEASIVDRFALMVKKFPARPAVQDAQHAWTYGELNERVEAVAGMLAACGVEPETNVGLLLGHDAPMIAGLMGVLRAGCTYVPLAKRDPAARINKVIADASIAALVVGEGCDSLLQEIEKQLPVVSVSAMHLPEVVAPARNVRPDQLAYVLFTSGSTGAPKGVMQTHRNVLHHTQAYSNALHLNEHDRLSLLPNYAFDAAVMDIFAALLNGACIYPLDVLAAASGPELLAAVSQQRLSVLHATPTVFRYLLEEGAAAPDLTNVRVVVLGGEEVCAADLQLFCSHFSADALFVNGLGPSESTTALQFFADRNTRLCGSVVPVGLPVAGTEVTVIDAEGRASGIGGELCLRSRWVSPGYWNLPQLTAQKFLPDPFDPSRTLYRTGDLVRYQPDGQLVFMGRLDAQVKLRGHRIEPAEIESALKSINGVERAAVMLKPTASAKSVRSASDDTQLVAYIQGAADVAVLADALRTMLPGYMVPACYIRLQHWPLLANGKLDRRHLPEPDSQISSARERAEPRNDTERSLLGIWSEILQPEVIGINDDFFALGGHSLKATRVVARIRDRFGVELRLRDLFAKPTIAGLAQLVAAADEDRGRPILQAQPAGVLPPLSWAQQRLWFLDQLEPGSAAYNLHWAAQLEGALDAASLQRAVDALVARHASLRTTFGGDDGNPVQLVAPVLRIPVDVEALGAVSAERLHARLLDLIRRPFNLQSGPLLRIHLLEQSADRSTLLLVMHHIVSDGWSMGILFRELALLYQAEVNSEDPKLPILPVQYTDYAVWQRAWLSGGELERQEEYWRMKLAEAPPLLDLPLDHVRPPVQRYRGAWVSAHLSAELLQRLHGLAATQGATLFMVLLTAFKIVVARHTGREDILIGTPIAGRRRTELEGLIGFFLNTLVLRTDLSGNPDFSAALQRVKETTLGAYDHQELPFEKLLEILQPARSTAYTPVVQVMFNLHNEPGGAAGLAGVQVKPFAVDRGTAKFDLSVAVVENENGLQVGFEYNTDLFERETVQSLLDHFATVLSEIVAAPELRLAEFRLTETEPGPRPDQAFQMLPVTVKEQTLLVRFEEMAQRFAARPAVDDGDICWTYARLNDYANVTGAWLAQLVEPGARVGLLLGHDAPMVAGLLGVLKAGCTYVPLDPESPPARIRAIIDEADLAAVVTDGMHRTLLHAAVNGSVAVVEVPEDAACGAPAPDCSKYLPDDLAYILFTSGSTGTPKGVMQTHRNVLHHARTYINALHINESDRLSLFSTYGFDASVMDIFGALLSGACLCPVDMRAQQHPGELLDRIGLNEDADGRSTAVTVLHTTPTVFRFLMRHKVCRHELTGIRLVVLGGEEARAADFALFKRHFAPPTLFVNGLGPSESTLAAQFFADHSTRLPGQVVPIGYAVADTVLELLNDDGSPAGVQGELAVCSPYVSLGYWRQPDLTTEKFVAAATSQQPGRIQYRTGDRARRLPDGQLVYLGRADGQLKLRGHRIEPGEIEAQLAGLRGVDRCTVMLRSDAADGRQSEARLVAYIVKQDGADDADVGVGIVRTKLKALLPEYMVPQALVLVDDLPLLPNGKVDRKRLPAPDWTRAESASFVKPRTATEQQLAGIWSEILGVSRVGVHDDFFELGGHSLLAAQLVARVTESMQIGLPLRRLFDAPTIAGLAEHVDALQWALQNQPEPRPRS